MEERRQCKEKETVRKRGKVLRKIKTENSLVFVNLKSKLYLKE
jgi:hypothetical protein